VFAAVVVVVVAAAAAAAVAEADRTAGQPTAAQRRARQAGQHKGGADKWKQAGREKRRKEASDTTLRNRLGGDRFPPPSVLRVLPVCSSRFAFVGLWPGVAASDPHIRRISTVYRSI
jgi:hypothetical protein